ncbi:MAG TPA: hypothetical protein VFH51_03510, partial [Myxococcota bacterium]|nr:hypothetical protein [Myxococcota bacterium]
STPPGGGPGPGGTTTTGGTTGGVPPPPVASASLSGHVSSSILDAGGDDPGGGAAGVVSKPSPRWRRTDTNDCASQTLRAMEVGGNGSVIATGVVAPDGAFTLSWTAQLDSAAAAPAEVVLEVSCATSATPVLRCYGKPGDTELLCDPVHNAVVHALEQSLGARVEASPLYHGLSIAKIAAGLVETLKLVSHLNPNSDFADALASADSAEAYKVIIGGSPVGALFQSLQTLAQQRAAKNEASGGGDTVVTQALQSVWTPGKVINLLAGVGLRVDVSLDDGDGVGLYSPLARFIDQMSGTTFLADTARYVSSLYDDLYGVSPKDSAVTLLCVGKVQSNSFSVPPARYPPDPNGMLADGVTRQLTCLGPTAVRLNVATAPGQLAPNYRVGAYIVSTFSEADRNDPDGTHGDGGNGSDNLEMGLVDIFPEFQALLSTGACAIHCPSCANGGPDASTDMAALAQCVRDNNADRYFAGALGTYRFLTDSALQDVAISLEDIYVALVDGFGYRLTADFQAAEARGFSIELTDQPAGQNQAYVPILLFDTQQVAGTDA